MKTVKDMQENYAAYLGKKDIERLTSLKNNPVSKETKEVAELRYGSGSETSLWPFAFPVSFIFLLVVSFWMNNSNYEKVESFCTSKTPIGYKFTTGDINSSWYDDICNYESLPNLHYKSCYLKWNQTAYHGMIISEDTCTEVKT